MIVDYHMHLRNEAEEIEHTPEAVEPFVERAAERGVDEIGFTEHIYYFEQTRSLWTRPYELERCSQDLDRYCEAILEAKRRGLPVKLGLEVDWVPGRADEVRELLAPYPWDFLLGSVHWVEGGAVDQEPGAWASLSADEVWRRYFADVRDAALSGLYDSLSHPDLVKIFGRLGSDDVVQTEYEATVDAVAEAGVCVEVSSAGLHKPVGRIYPEPELLALFRVHDVPITLASDAHVPRNVGRDLDAAVEHARGAGYATVTVFDGRERRQEPIG